MFCSGSMLICVQRRNPVLCTPSTPFPPSKKNHPSNWAFVFQMSPMSLLPPMDPVSIRDQIIGIVPEASMDPRTIRAQIGMIVPIITENPINPINPIDPIAPALSMVSRVPQVRIVPAGCFNRNSSSCPTLAVFAGD